MNTSFKNSRWLGSLVVMCAVGALLAGCGKKDGGATQTVARVDGEEISVHQINGVLSKASGITPENLPKAKREILSGLVDQQLAVNLAMEKKLDRNPEVVTAIENAKRDILARAAIDHMVAGQTKPTDEEAQKYYAEHPALFEQRRLFSLQEIAISKAKQHNLAEITAKVATAKSMEEVGNWLKEQKIEFTANAGNRSAEQIPLEMLPRLHTFKDGQIGVIEGADAIVVMRVLASRAQPVTAEQAVPKIKLFLSNQRNTATVKRMRDEMKAKAKIEYFGEFAGGEAALKAKAEADAKAAADAAQQAKAKSKDDAEALAKQKAQEQAAAQAEAEARSKARAEARAQSATEGKTSEPATVNLEKGIKGLK